MVSVQARKSCFFCLHPQEYLEDQKYRDEEDLAEKLESLKSKRLCFLPKMFGKHERVCLVGPSLLVDLGSACLLAAPQAQMHRFRVFAFSVGKDGLLQFQSGFQGRVRSGPAGMRRGIFFLFVVSRTFRILGGSGRN